MNNFEDIVTEIYIQIAKFTNTDKDPYYLFISKENYNIMKSELVDIKTDAFPNGRLDFFKVSDSISMEVVPLNGVPKNYIEIRGIIKKYAV